MPNNKIQSLTVNGVTYDIVDNTSGYINAQYIENKTDYSIPVSRVGEIEVGETAIGTDSTNFPTSKAVVDYVDERVVQEIDAIDVGVTGIKADGTSLSVVDGIVNIPAIGPNQSIGLMTDQWMQQIWNELGSIPQNTSDLYNDSGFITSETDPTVPAWAKASTKPTYTASEVGALPDSTVITDEKLKVNKTSDNGTYYPILTSDSTEAQTKLRYAGLYSTIGNSDISLTIGSNNATNFKTGKLKLTNHTFYTTIVPSNNGQSNTITLPNKTGTVALLDDIPTVPTNISSFTNDSGYLTASDIASVMIYKGTKANYAALPASGNTTGDVWHLTDTGAEWAWDGSAWQELGTAIDLSNYATKATTLSGYGITDANIQNGTITLGSNSITPLTSFTETDPTVPSWAKASSKPSYGLTEISGTDDLRAIEGLTGTSGLLKKTAANTWTLDTNTYLTSYTETDPTVPSWAKQSSKPTYTAAEVGALPDTTTIPSKVSDLTNDSGFITGYTETDPIFSASAASGITATDISNWNGKSSTDEKLAVAEVSDSSTYYPIFGSGTAAATRLYDSNGFKYQSASNTAYLFLGTRNSKNGRLTLIQGNYYKALEPTTLTSSGIIYLPNKDGTIALTSDIPTVPTKVSDLTNDSGFISSYTETDPVFAASAAAGITSTDISNWNAKVSDDKTWNGVSLTKGAATRAAATYLPQMESTTATSAALVKTTSTPEAYVIPKYDGNTYLYSTTPSANDNSTKVATTAYVDAAIPDVSGFITTDTNTTYTLSNALSSHKFTETLTAGGSGSGTSTATMEFVAGTGITLTDDTTNKKLTIACNVTNTDENVKYSKITTNQAYSIMLSGLASSSDTSPYTSTLNRTNTLTYNPSTKALITGGTVDGYTLAAASAKAVDSSISTGSSSANLPTSAAVASFVEGKGYLTLATLPIYDGTVE